MSGNQRFSFLPFFVPTLRISGLMESNGTCRRYVALQSHGRSHRRCTSEFTHPQRSPRGKCHVASNWQGNFPATYQTKNNNLSDPILLYPQWRGCSSLCLRVKRSYGPLFPRLMYHLVPILSSVLFVFTQAFHIFYSDQIELVSVFPILIKLNRFQLFYSNQHE